MQKLSNIIIILLFASSSYGQVYQAYINAADIAYESKDFRTALSYYGQAIEMDTEVDLDVLTKYAKSAQAYQSYNKAKSAYQQILNLNDDAVKSDALFQLGRLSKSLGEYEEAKSYFDEFLGLQGNSEDRTVSVNKSLEDIAWALANDTKSIYEVERLSETVNTEYSEMSPVEYNGTLYFSSNNYFASSETIYPQSKVYANEEGKSSRLTSPLNDEGAHVGHYTMNSDMTVTYFTKCKYANAEVVCKIFQQDASGVISELPSSINAPNAHTTQPNIGVDSKTGNEVLYFVSDRSNGVGGLDIYYAPIENGVFKGPYALDRINTPGDEVSPFFHAGTSKLYFSTDGRKTFGGLDVYASSVKEGYGEPVNLGSGINSSYDDAYFSLNSDGEAGYFASNRTGSSYIDSDLEACCYDIYKAKLDVTTQSILAKVYNSESKEPIAGAKLTLSALPTIDLKELYDASLAEYQLVIRSDLVYDLNASKAGYELAKFTLDNESDEEFEIYLKPISLDLKAFVINEDKVKLSDYTYTITSESDDEGKAKKVKTEKKISESITKHQDYVIKVEKDGYYPETVTLSQDRLLKEDILDLDIILKKVPDAVLTKLTLDGYLPLPLFFDNDEPDQNTISVTTTKNYHQTYTSYIQRKEEYVSKNVAGLNAEQRMDAESTVRNFFEAKVKVGDAALEGFTEHLFSFLQQGSQAEIMLRGYASPRSQSDYNDALTSRRVRSVENHFYQWRGGALVSYINSGQLKLTERPLGESQAPAGVSDELSDQKGSIYSVEASTERRVEILEIKSANVNPY